uniref:Uncharacterized protein n=1 Tax=Anguilla anguilla TaxID=7936 RepID=A0A0E9UD33_ANGAN
MAKLIFDSLYTDLHFFCLFLVLGFLWQA